MPQKSGPNTQKTFYAENAFRLPTSGVFSSRETSIWGLVHSGCLPHSRGKYTQSQDLIHRKRIPVAYLRCFLIQRVFEMGLVHSGCLPQVFSHPWRHRYGGWCIRVAYLRCFLTSRRDLTPRTSSIKTLIGGVIPFDPWDKQYANLLHRQRRSVISPLSSR
jgi:hypothetical protein